LAHNRGYQTADPLKRVHVGQLPEREPA